MNQAFHSNDFFAWGCGLFLFNVLLWERDFHQSSFDLNKEEVACFPIMPKVTVFDRERISHGPTSLKIVVLVLVATFVQILHLFHEVLVLFIELHRIHEEFWKSRKSLWMSLKVSESLWNSQKVSESLLKVSESLWKSLKVSESLLKVSESLLMNLTVMHSKPVLSLFVFSDSCTKWRKWSVLGTKRLYSFKCHVCRQLFLQDLLPKIWRAWKCTWQSSL